MMVLYATVANSQIESLSFDQPMNYMRDKRPKILTRIDKDDYLRPGEFVFEDHRFNQYFLDKIKEVNNERFQTLKDVGISDNESIKIVYQKLQEIADAAFRDFIDDRFRPQDIEDIEKRIKMQNEVLTIYREVEKLKNENNRQFKANKALALLNLNNYRDELKIKRRKEKEERLKEEHQLEQERINHLDEIEKEKRYKKQKLEEAKRILEQAKKRREKNKKEKS
jgi:hypothetical protein